MIRLASLPLDFIDAVMVTRGHIGRDDIMTAFGVSVATASRMLAEFQLQHPGAITLDHSRNRYVPCENPYRTMRGQSAGDFVMRIPIDP